MKDLHHLSRCAFIVCDMHETASRVLRLALYTNWCRSLGRVEKGPILFNTNDSRPLGAPGCMLSDAFVERRDSWVPGIGLYASAYGQLEQVG